MLILEDQEAEQAGESEDWMPVPREDARGLVTVTVMRPTRLAPRRRPLLRDVGFGACARGKINDV
eukprot:5693371-Prymnesium_polylepis.1